jgi:hypothetical protein
VRCTDILSLTELALCLYVEEKMNVRRLNTNKEEEEVGGCSPTLGEPHISCVLIWFVRCNL